MKDQSSFEAWGPKKDQSMMNLVQLAQNVWNSCLRIFPVIFNLFGEEQDHII